MDMGWAAPDPFGVNITVASTSFCRKTMDPIDTFMEAMFRPWRVERESMTPRLTAASFPMLRWQPAKAMQTSTGRRLLTLLIIPVVPGLGTRGGGLAGVVCRGVGIGFLVEFFRIRHEQDVIAAV